MIILFLLTLALLFSNPLFAQESMKVIAVEYPPFLTEQSKTFGTSFFLLKQYADKHFKVDYEPLFIPPGRAQRIMEQGKWCISFFPPNQQDKKAKFILLSPNHVKLGLYRINQHKAFNYSSLSELQGSVAILRTNSLGLMHSILEGAGLKLVHVETIEQGIHMLLAGRVDYTFGDNTTINTYSEIKGINTLQFSDVPLSEFPVGFYYNLDCEEVLFKAKP